MQYYDEIGLLKPSELTAGGYRLYNDDALQKLQQILFFKELGFKLKEINGLISKPDFDLFIQKIKDDEAKVAKLAIKEFGSIEKYTEAMKYHLEHFSEIMEQQMSGDVKALLICIPFVSKFLHKT